MKKVFIVVLTTIAYNTVFAQSETEITLDMKSYSLGDSKAIFKVGNSLSFCLIDYDPKKDSITFEYTATETLNEAGLAKFIEIGSIQKAEIKGTKTCFLPFKVADKDYSHLNIKRYQKSKLIEERTYKYRNTGGIKFDVSSGFFATSLKDSLYALKHSSDSTNIIIPEAVGKIRVGLGLLAHLHTRSKGNINIGACLGFEINNDVKVSYLCGASLFLGADKKFVLNAGLALSKVDVLSRVYKEHEVISDAVAVVPLVKVWKYGWFVGASYNF